MEGGPVLPAQLRDRDAGLVLLQDPEICSSEKRLRFMLWPSISVRANFTMDWGQRATSGAMLKP